MISVQKPAECPQPLQEENCLNYVRKVCRRRGSIKIHNRYYRHEKVKGALQNIYRGKCAYCEAELNVTSSSQIEHFRPKGGVKGVSGHGGYYWLAHEWSNLLLACSACNLNKSNRFPLKDEETRCGGEPQFNGDKLCTSWVDPHAGLLDKEERLLLNPEWDQVEAHFFFTPDGKIHSNTDQGKKSIEVYDLNRIGLVHSRKQISEHYSRRIERQVKIFLNNVHKITDEEGEKFNNVFQDFSVQVKEILNEMHAKIHLKETFLAYRVYMTVLFFDEFIIQGLPEPCRDIVQHLVHEYRRTI